MLTEDAVQYVEAGFKPSNRWGGSGIFKAGDWDG
jgi:hypothetical protein